ncbi:hypothetical protein PENSPDRAFT_681944 [Peniophora sp. CONT]|nr:hypothetical protein PENSPDRAFT_681944 [Peniophora sp. CONT]
MDEIRTVPAVNTDAQSTGDAPPLLQTLDAQAFWSRCYETRLPGLDTPQSVTTESSIEAYDIEINAAMNAVFALRYRRNRLLPIFRLPSELLLRVMQECAGFHSIRNMTKSTISWLALTHACTTFRDLALQYPLLWTNVTTILGWSWSQEFLARSNGILHGLDINSPVDQRFAEGLRRQMITLERLSVQTADPPDWSEPLIHLLAYSSPNLREAILVGGEYCGEYSESQRLSPDVINGASLLQYLSIINFDIVWRPLVWPNLRSLKVDLSSLYMDNVSFVENFTDVVDCLRASPALENLEFIRCLGPSPSPADPLPKVVLPRLSNLVMSDAFDVSLALLETIEAPHLVKLNLRFCFLDPVTDAQGEKIANALKAYKPPLHSALLEPMRRGYRISAWNHLLARSDDGSIPSPLPWNRPETDNTAAVRIELEAYTNSEIVAVILEALSLADLQALSLMLPRNYSDAKGWDRDTWQRILSCAHRLQFLHVYGSHYSLENTPGELCRTLATPRPYGDGTVYLPSLKSLTLEHVRLDGEFMGSPFFRKLLQFLHRRAGLGASIHTLHLEDCSEAARALEECFLRVPGLTVVEYVGDGTWDTDCRIDERDV